MDLELYDVVYEKISTGFSCFSRILLGCVSVGSTRVECENNMRDAIRLHLEGLREDDIEVRIDPKGSVFWHSVLFGLHRDGDLPAIEWKDGIRKEWYKKGLLHRVGGYALIDIDGNREWYKKGKLHRGGDLPAIEKVSGSKYWYINGKKHRENGPATILANGVEEFWIDGKKNKKEKYCE